MRKKSVIALLSLLSTVAIAFGVSGCSETESKPLTVNGFDVTETMEVNVGSSVELEQLTVIDEKGVLLDCWTYVTDADGNYVSTDAGSFSADDLDGYTITYVVRASDNTTYQKQTKVTVKGGSGEVVETTLDVNYEQFITVGEEVTIDAVCSDAQATLAYEVKKSSSGETVDVTDGAFTPQNAGVYEVKVSVVGGEASYKYNVFAEAPLKDGEVETFNDAWLEKETFVGGKRQDWEIISSSENGLLDPYGREATFAKYSTEREYIPLFINIREDVEYYKALAEDGYTYVSMWIYMESNTPHITVSDRDPNGGFYRKAGPTLYPNQWVEFRLDLKTGKNSWNRSFIQCYEYYANQNHFYMQVDNSDTYNTWGGGDSIAFYFSDIYAVKPVSISLAETLPETTKAVEDTIDTATYFNADFDLSYVVNYRGKKAEAVNGGYQFTANGDYTLTAVPKEYHLRGEASVALTVTDGHSLVATPVIKERTGETVSVDISGLNATFNETDGVTPTVEEYKVYFKGEELALENGVFTASADGAYSVEVKGVYEKDGNARQTYKTFPVDVWSTATKYDVIDVENMYAIRVWDGAYGKVAAPEYNEFTVGGRTGKYVKVVSTAGNQTAALYAKPVYSKAYYQALAQESDGLKARVSLYYEPSATGNVTNFKSVFTSTTTATRWDESYDNNWLSFEMSMDSFISQYDEIVGKYDQYINATSGGGTEGGAGAWLYVYGGGVKRTLYLSVVLGEEATEATVVLKADKAFALDTKNDLNEILDVTLDGESGAIVTAQVYFNEEWIELSDKMFNPAWAAEYNFRFGVETANGLKYKELEKSFAIGGEAFEATVDTDVYTLKGDEQFDVKSILDGDYTFELETFKTRGGTLTQVEVADGTVMKGNALEVGAYLINVYATKGDGAFGRILYYTLTLDYLGDYETPVWVETPTADNMTTLFKSYQYAHNQFMTCTTVTTECPEGRSGTFIKYEGVDDKRKEQMAYATMPLFSKNYYKSLVESEKLYSLKFDVYLENVDAACERTEALYSYWGVDGTSFTTHGGKLTLGVWYTLEIPLETLVNNLNGDVKVFAIQIYYNGTTENLMRFWLGNFRLEEAPMLWSAETLTTAMLTSYQYDTSQNLLDISLTTEIPEGGVTGTYVKYTQTVSKGAYKVAVAPAYTKNYYEKLLATGNNYKVTFDFYVENSDSACTRTQMPMMAWCTKDDGTQSFASSTMVTLGAWYTMELDLQYLVDNWGSNLIFGVNFEFKGNTLSDFTNYWFGNIRLVEGEASGAPALKASVEA